MLTHLSKESIGKWYQKLMATQAGGIVVNHLKFIATSIWSQLTVYSKLKSKDVQKPEGDWTTWGLQDLVKVLTRLAPSGEKSSTFTAIATDLANMDWEQNVEKLSDQHLWDQLSKIQKDHGLLTENIQLSESELRTLVATVRSKLKAPGIKAANKTFNNNIANALAKFEGKTFEDLMIEIGNFNLEVKSRREALQLMVGKVTVVGDSGNHHDNKSDKGSGQGGYDKAKGSGKGGQDHNKKKPRFNNSEKDYSDKKGEDHINECTVCGVPHKGECTLRNHPNANLSKLPWKESVNGKLFAALRPVSWKKLPKYMKLSDDKKSLILIEKERLLNLKIFSINLSNPVNDNKQATFKWKQKGLIDSGAKGGGPYIDFNLADK
jgi:hypothetical protein